MELYKDVPSNVFYKKGGFQKYMKYCKNLEF